MATTQVTPIQLDVKNFNCQRCDLYKNKKNYVFPSGNMSGTILLVGEAPGQDEDLLGQPFIGKPGQLLKEIITKANIPLTDIMIHNCCMCRPPNRLPSTEELVACYPYLLWTIQNMPNLKIVVLLGATALYAGLKLKRIIEKRGTLIQKDGVLYMPTFHPSYVLRNADSRELIERDFSFINEYINKKISSGVHETITNTQELIACLEELKVNHTLAVDIETSTHDKTKFSNFLTDEIIGISFAWKEKHGVYIPFIAEDKEVWIPQTKEYIISTLKDILESKEKKLILHGGHFDAQFLRKKFNININQHYDIDGKVKLNYYFDTMYAHHLINENLPHDLDWLTRQFSDLAFYKGELEIYKKQNKIKDYAKIPLAIIGKYGAGDADGTFRLYKKLSVELEKGGFTNLFLGLVMPLAVSLNDTEFKGVKVDLDLLKSLEVSYSQKIKVQEGLIHAAAGEVFNINSRAQVRRILFEKLKLPPPQKMTESNLISTEADELKKLEKEHAIIPLLLTYYKLTKLHSTYIVSLMEKADSDQRIHTFYKIDGTDTGRLCVDADTIINTTDGSFKISEIDLQKYPGCAVLTHEDRVRPIIGKYYKGKEVMFEVQSKNGGKITCTAGHRFLTADGWTHLYDLREGSKIWAYDLKHAEEIIKSVHGRQGNSESPRHGRLMRKTIITKITPVGIKDVWDIQVDGDHSYCAGGYINHNSSKAPNLQNIPADDQFRKIFVAKPGYQFIISDYSQIELRVMASLSNDPIMLQTFREGRDIHTETIAKILNKPIDQITKKERKIAKAINFGLIYGMSAEGLMNNQNLIDTGIKLTKKEAESFIAQYFKNFQGVKTYQDKILSNTRRIKKVSTLLGRFRHIEDINHPNGFLRGNAERAALNSPIQGTAGECTNMATVRLYFEFAKRAIDGCMVLTVHDELVYEVRNDQVELAAKLIYQIMRDTGESLLKLPVEIDQAVNSMWVEHKELSDENPIDYQKEYLKANGYQEDLLKKIPVDFLAGKRI